MAGMINQLIDLLNEQAERYQELLGLSIEKKSAIISNDVDALQKITHLENLVVSQTQKLEKKRLAVMKDIAAVVNKQEEELTLSALIEMMQGQKEQEELSAAGSRIRETLGGLSEANAHNASLIKNALDYIEYSINIIRSSVSQAPPMYTNKGEQISDAPGVFDAKH